MTTATKREEMIERIRKHGETLLAIFPNATDRDPLSLCKKLRRLESKAAAIGLRMCNGPEYSEGEAEKVCAAVLAKVNALLGNVHDYQPRTGARCGCRPGVQRDNCGTCEGTGHVIDFRAIRNRKPLVPVFINRDPRGYALKINDEWIRQQRADHRTAYKAAIHQDWGGYGIIAPDLTDSD